MVTFRDVIFSAHQLTNMIYFKIALSNKVIFFKKKNTQTEVFLSAFVCIVYLFCLFFVCRDSYFQRWVFEDNINKPDYCFVPCIFSFLPCFWGDNVLCCKKCLLPSVSTLRYMMRKSRRYNIAALRFNTQIRLHHIGFIALDSLVILCIN